MTRRVIELWVCENEISAGVVTWMSQTATVAPSTISSEETARSVSTRDEISEAFREIPILNPDE